MQDKTYSVNLKCSNCGYTFYEEINKGITIEKYSEIHGCPHCGCLGMVDKSYIVPEVPSEKLYES